MHLAHKIETRLRYNRMKKYDICYDTTICKDRSSKGGRAQYPLISNEGGDVCVLKNVYVYIYIYIYIYI